MVEGNELFSQVIGRVYEAAADPALWAPSIEKLAGHTESDSAALLVEALERC
jgi:hypothetical protein